MCVRVRVSVVFVVMYARTRFKSMGMGNGFVFYGAVCCFDTGLI